MAECFRSLPARGSEGRRGKPGEQALRVLDSHFQAGPLPCALAGRCRGLWPGVWAAGRMEAVGGEECCLGEHRDRGEPARCGSGVDVGVGFHGTGNSSCQGMNLGSFGEQA